MIEWWQSIPTIAQQVIIGLIVVIITYIFSFPVRKLIIRSLERKKKHDDRLKVHFQELKKEAQEIIRTITRVSVRYGEIVSRFQVTYSDFSAVVLPQLSDTFTVHFPKEARDSMEYKQKIEDHNQNYERFCAKISKSIESQEIPVVNIKSPVTPCIYDSIFAPLFQRWQELAIGRRPWPDFSAIQQVDVEGDYIHLYPEAWGASTIACVRGKNDKERCERIIRGVAENKEFEEEAAKLISDANELVEQVRSLLRRLIYKLDDTDKFWPGTKRYRFKEVKSCPRCKELFH